MPSSEGESLRIEAAAPEKAINDMHPELASYARDVNLDAKTGAPSTASESDGALTLSRTVRDCAYGMAVGDALGVPYEFKPRGSFECESAGEPGNSSGYVWDTYNAAIWCLEHTSSYRDCVLAAVNLGDDTDTTACVAGGLAGILYGFKGIPTEWVETLRGKNVIESCLFD